MRTVLIPSRFVVMAIRRAGRAPRSFFTGESNSFLPSSSAMAAAAWHAICHCNSPVLANNEFVAIRVRNQRGKGHEASSYFVGMLTWGLVLAGVCQAVDPQEIGGPPAAARLPHRRDAARLPRRQFRYSMPPNNGGTESNARAAWLRRRLRRRLLPPRPRPRRRQPPRQRLFRRLRTLPPPAMLPTRQPIPIRRPTAAAQIPTPTNTTATTHPTVTHPTATTPTATTRPTATPARHNALHVCLQSVDRSPLDVGPLYWRLLALQPESLSRLRLSWGGFAPADQLYGLGPVQQLMGVAAWSAAAGQCELRCQRQSECQWQWQRQWQRGQRQSGTCEQQSAARRCRRRSGRAQAAGCGGRQGAGNRLEVHYLWRRPFWKPEVQRRPGAVSQRGPRMPDTG